MLKQARKKKRYDNIILIPNDFSEVCENAILHGIELAQFLHYSVCVLHVIPPAKETDEITGSTVQEQIQMKFRKCREDFGTKYNVKIDLLVKEGNILKVINKTAKEIKANLMILGTHGKQGLQHLFGSHALRVVLDSPCPVVVVQKRSFESGYKKIVLPVSSDFEPLQSIGWVALMNRLFNSRIHLFLSFEPDIALRNRLKLTLDQICKIFDEKKIPYETGTESSEGDFSARIISYAISHHSDLIMIMTMPGEDVAGFNFPAWNEKLMFNEAHIPVMCVNPVDFSDVWMM